MTLVIADSAEPVALEQVEAVAHQDVVVGLVAGRAAQLLDAGALGDGDPDLGEQDALDVQGHEQRSVGPSRRVAISPISVDDVGPPRPRQVVAHVGVHDELGAGDGPGGGDPAARLHERIGEAVDDERRHPDPTEVPGAIAAGGDGQALAAGAVGSVAAVERLLASSARRPRASKCGPDVRLNPYTPFSTAWLGSLAIALGSLRSSDRLVRPCLRSPVFDMIDVRLATWPGWRMAIAWAIMPPIDAPTTWVGPMSRWSSSWAASSAMSSTVYVALTKRGAMTDKMSWRRGRRRRVDGAREPDVAVVEPDHLEPGGDEQVDELQRPRDQLGAPAP